MPPDLLTTRQVAHHLGTNVRRVNRLVKAGKLRTVIKLEGVTGANLFEPAEVERFAADRPEGGTSLSRPDMDGAA